MNMEGSDTWDEEEIDAFEHGRWLLMQEMGDDYYKLFENNDSKGEDEEQSIRRIESRKKRKSQIGILQSNRMC